MRTGTGPPAGPHASGQAECESDGRHEARRSCYHLPRKIRSLVEVKDDQWVGFAPGLRRLSASRRPTRRQMVAERRGRPNGRRDEQPTTFLKGSEQVVPTGPILGGIRTSVTPIDGEGGVKNEAPHFANRLSAAACVPSPASTGWSSVCSSTTSARARSMASVSALVPSTVVARVSFA